MVYNDLIADFNLYLCEKFGYRNSCSAMQNVNGICVSVSERKLDLYIRFWEYSNGRGNFPDWSSRSTRLGTATNSSVQKVMVTDITKHSV